MSQTLMHSEYHPTDYTAPVGAVDQILKWLTEREEKATPSQFASLVIAGQLMTEMNAGDEPVEIDRDEAVDIARALRAEIASEPTPPAGNEADLREHIGELADAIALLAEQHEVLRLSLV